jgi:hypothetical protein
VALRQAAFQFYADDGTESTSTPLADTNVGITRQIDASTFLIRFLIQSDDGTVASNTVPQFQFQRNGGSWVNITDASSFIRAVTTTVFSNGQDCTQRLGGTGAFDANNDGCTHTGDAGGAQMDIAANGNNETICAVQLVPAQLQADDVIGIRITTTPTAITVWDTAATVTLTSGATPYTGEPATASVAVTGLAPTVLRGLTGLLPPDAILASSNLTGSVDDVDDATSSPDEAWLVATTPGVATDARFAFPSPPSALLGAQTFRIWLRSTPYEGDPPEVDVELWQGGSLVRVLLAAQPITSLTGQLVEATFSAAEVNPDGANIEVRVRGEPE